MATHTLVVFPYNAANTAVYFNSINDFPEHMDWSHYRLTDFKHPWDYTLVAGLSLLDSSILLANQLSYPKHINKLWCRINGKAFSAHDSKNRWEIVIAGTAAAVKGITGSTSTWALANDHLPFSVATTIFAITIPGNMAAQLGIFAEHTGWNMGWRNSSKTNAISHILIGFYNGTNIILYWNAWNNALINLGYLDERAGPVGQSLNAACFWAGIVGSTFMLFETQKKYVGKIHKVFTGNYPGEGDATCTAGGAWISTLMAAGYKTAVNTLALAVIFNTAGMDEDSSLAASAATSLASNLLSNISVFIPSTNTLRNTCRNTLHMLSFGFFGKSSDSDEASERTPLVASTNNSEGEGQTTVLPPNTYMYGSTETS